MKSKIYFFAFALSLCFLVQNTQAQVAISASGSPTPDGSAILDLQSTELGFLVPRMTEAERNAISSPAKGLIIYQTNGATPGLYFNFGDHSSPDWNHLTDEETPQGYWDQNGTLLYYNDGNVGIGTATPAVPLDVVGAAQVSGTMQVGGLQLASGASNGYVLTSDGSGNATWQAAAGADGDWTVNGNDVYSAVSGNVGIGTSTPGNKLHVQGDARITGALQLDNGASNGYVLSSDASGNASWADVDALVSNDDDWTINVNDMYSAPSGNVGIGTSAPGTKLDVNGPAWFGDSIYVAGRPGRVRIQGEQGHYPVLHYEYRDTTKFSFYFQPKETGFSTDYLILSSFDSENNIPTHGGFPEVMGFNPEGRIFQDYQGDGPVHMMYSNAASPMLYIDVNNSGEDANGIQSRVTSATSDIGSVCIGGWNKGEGKAVYGENDLYGNYGYLGTNNNGVYGQHGTSENRGALGTSSSGAYGLHVANDNQGTLGLENYGVQGTNGSSDFWGAIGTSSAGIFGRLTPDGSTQTLSDGDFGVKGLGVEISTNSGSDYDYGSTMGGVVGYNEEGTAYSFGVAGYTETFNNNRSGGVLGSLANGSIWGSLAYRANNSSRYGGYFTSTTTGSGKNSSDPSVNIGIGVYGDLFGAHISGDVYGLYASGENYGIYADGDMYRTGADVHLQPNATGQNTVMYTQVSTEMTVQTYGIGQLQGGKSNINFDEAFSGIVSENEPIIVTITPIGQSNGVYLEKVDGRGFNVVENNDGKSNVQFSWIAIGKRQGYENHALPSDVIDPDYTNKVNNGLHNDNDRTGSATGIYYHNGQLFTGSPVISRTSQNKPEIQEMDRGPVIDIDKGEGPSHDKQIDNGLPVIK